MMASNNAGGFASSLIKRATDKLTSLFLSSILPSSSSSAPESDAAFEDLKKLESTMKRIQAIVSDAEQRGVKGHAGKLRLEELKEVAYDADDVVEEYEFEVLSAKIKFGGDNHNRKRGDEVCQVMIPSQIIVPVPSELAIRVKRIRERFDEITSEWEALCFGEGEILGGSNVEMVTLSQSSSLMHEPSIHGRDDDKENIIKTFILNGSNYDGDGSLYVLPLVGMGGIGKTTLAQLVYNDPRVCEYFQLKAWVCVSENFSVNILTRNIIVSFTNDKCDFTELDNLQRTLMDIVKGKMFLIVFDDVWNEKPGLWHLLKAPLTSIGFGKIIVTTRNENVARYMQTTSSYALTYLPFDHCWSLFKQLAFECHDPNLNPRMLEIGREIVRKCAGLPLAVKAIGSLLQFEDDEENWCEILDSERWELDMTKSEVLPALKISYDRLPLHLKRCFVFLSLFPKDIVIFEDDLVRLWLSLDLVNPHGRKSLEDTGVGYVTELMQRSMLQLTLKKKRCFSMHDLVNDLSRSVSGNDFSRIGFDRLHELPSEVRYVSIFCNHQFKIIDLQYLNNLRAPRLLQIIDTMNYGGRASIPNYVWYTSSKVKILDELFQKLKYLRALDFSYNYIQTLPDSIGNLRHLRYLNVRSTQIRNLPDTICDLYNLEILELNNSRFSELPIRIGCLVNLRHLGLNAHMCSPPGIGQLLNLQTLPIFTVNHGTWHCTLSELKNLDLRNQLEIYGLGHVTTTTGVRGAEAILRRKRYLKKLTLSWDDFSCDHSKDEVHINSMHAELLWILKPHTNIEELRILNYRGLSFPRWLGDVSFSKLIKFTLCGGHGITSKFLPTLGQLPSLRVLKIGRMSILENVGREFCSRDSTAVCFRSLNTLKFLSMFEWKNWSGVKNGDFSSLKTLRLKVCNKLQFIPQQLYSSLSTLEVDHCKILTTPHLLPSLNCLIMNGRISKVFLDGLYLPLLKILKLQFLESSTSLVLTSQHLPSIEAIEIVYCKVLRTIVGLGCLGSLKKIELRLCENLQFASDERLPHELQRLVIYKCPQLHDWYQLQNKRESRMEASFM